MAIVYKHIRLDNKEVFYVGIGSQKKRAYSKCKRSKFWHNIVNKTDYEVFIVKENVSVEEAYQLEKDLIKLYGRRDLGVGTLVNMTDGGDGRFGAIVRDETKKKMSKAHKGRKAPWAKLPRSKQVLEQISFKLKEHWKYNKKPPHTEETKEKIRKSLLGRPGHQLGKKHTKESIEKMKESHGKGKKNKNFGRKNSIETIKKMSESAKNRKKIVCPHCNKEGQISAMMTWHFNKCKNKNQIKCTES